jgi:ABC-type lipoprotein export system ATPase subunit
MNNPTLVLADEPSGNLDEDNSQKLHQLLSDLAQKMGLSFVIATHNLDLTKRAHRVLQLVDGRLVTGMRPLA